MIKMHASQRVYGGPRQMFTSPFRQLLCARFLTVVLLLSLAACGREQQSFQPPKPKTLTAAELQKLRWIEGSWRGTGVNQPPFFERYRFENDSTLTVDHLEDESFGRSEEHTSELQSPCNLVCRLLREKKSRERR